MIGNRWLKPEPIDVSPMYIFKHRDKLYMHFFLNKLVIYINESFCLAMLYLRRLDALGIQLRWGNQSVSGHLETRTTDMTMSFRFMVPASYYNIHK
jgi:hypothetical protein